MSRFCASCKNNAIPGSITSKAPCVICYFTVNDNGVHTKPDFKPIPRVADVNEDERRAISKLMEAHD
jgi:hypothetical protein